jgi:hypothetical protein
LRERIVDLANDIHKLIEVDGVCRTGIGTQLVAAQDVFFYRRRGEYDDGSIAQAVIGLDDFQNLATVVLRQVEVEPNEIGPRRISKATAPMEENQPRLAGAHDMQRIRDFALLKGFPGDELVSGVVLDQQDNDDPAVGLCTHREPFRRARPRIEKDGTRHRRKNWAGDIKQVTAIQTKPRCVLNTGVDPPGRLVGDPTKPDLSPPTELFFSHKLDLQTFCRRNER